MTIGSVCRQLRSEFSDISISKIRYLEDQKLLLPHRTAGGYRLYSSSDIERLRVILRAQRDKFLPLSVIRKGLESGRIKIKASEGGGSDTGAAPGVQVQYSRQELAGLPGASSKLISELEEYGILASSGRRSEAHYCEADREIVSAAAELAHFGVAGRNLRVFRSSAEKEAALLEQILAPALSSGNVKRRNEARETLENLATVAARLQHLILLRSLRSLAKS